MPIVGVVRLSGSRGELERRGRGLAALLEYVELLIGEFGPPTDVGQQRAQLDAPFGLDGVFEDGTHLGLGTAAVSRGAHPKGAVHVSDKFGTVTIGVRRVSYL